MSWMIACAALVVAAGACVQGSVGFGFALISAPALALFSSEFVPGPLLGASCLLSAAAAWRERGHVDRRGVLLLLVGRVPGALIGAALLKWLPRDAAGVLFGALVLLAVGLSALGLRVRRTRGTMLAVGTLSGVMGTTTAVGGPPVALVYQHAEPAALRSTLNAYFTFGGLLSIGALLIAGRFGLRDLAHTAWLLPCVGVGFLASHRLRGVLIGGRARAAVLWIAGTSAAAVIVKTLWFS